MYIYLRDPDFLYTEDIEKQASFISGIGRALTRGARTKLLRDAKLVRDELGGFNAYSTMPKDVKRNLINDFQQSIKGDYSRLSGLRDRIREARGNQDVIDSLRFDNLGTPGASFRSLANAENKALEAAARYGAKPSETRSLLSRLFSRSPKSTPSKAPSTAATSSPVSASSNVVDDVMYPLVPVGGKAAPSAADMFRFATNPSKNSNRILEEAAKATSKGNAVNRLNNAGELGLPYYGELVPVGGGRAMPSASDMFRFSNSSMRRPNNPLVPVADNPMLPSVINNTRGAATRGLTDAGELGLPYYGELANVGRTGARYSKYTKRPMRMAKGRVVEDEIINLPPATQQGLARASANLENSIVNPASTALVPVGGKAAPSAADMFRFATNPSKNSNMILEEAAKATSNRTANTAARNAIGKPTSAWSKSTRTSGSTSANTATNTANTAAAKASTNLENAVSNPAFSATTNPGSNTINMNLAGSNAPSFNAAVGGEAMNLTTAADRAVANTAARNAIGKPTSAWSRAANSSISREELAELINNAANSSRGLAWKVGAGSALGGGLLGTIGNRIFAPDPTIQYIQPSTQYYRQPEFIY